MFPGLKLFPNNLQMSLPLFSYSFIWNLKKTNSKIHHYDLVYKQKNKAAKVDFHAAHKVYFFLFIY